MTVFETRVNSAASIGIIGTVHSGLSVIGTMSAINNISSDLKLIDSILMILHKGIKTLYRSILNNISINLKVRRQHNKH